MARPPSPRTTTAEHILAAISLPTNAPAPVSPTPMPLVELSALARDGSLHYTIAHLDTSGRVADQSTVAALGWHLGDRLDTTVIQGILLIRRAPSGTTTVSAKGRIYIPAAARHQAGLAAGALFIAAAPAAGLALVHGLWCLDRMLTLHYRAVLDHHTAS